MAPLVPRISAVRLGTFVHHLYTSETVVVTSSSTGVPCVKCVYQHPLAFKKHPDHVIFACVEKLKFCTVLCANNLCSLLFASPSCDIYLFILHTAQINGVLCWLGTCCCANQWLVWRWPKVFSDPPSCPCRFKASLLALVIGRTT
jgi:hypothetical protein